MTELQYLIVVMPQVVRTKHSMRHIDTRINIFKVVIRLVVLSGDFQKNIIFRFIYMTVLHTSPLMVFGRENKKKKNGKVQFTK